MATSRRGLILLCASLFAVQLMAQSMPAVVAAAKDADWTLLQSLLDDGVDANAVYGDGSTALHWASYHENLASARRLLAVGADVNASTDLGVTPLWLAAQNGGADMVAALLQAGADATVSLYSGETLVMTAAQSGNGDVVAALLKAGADPNAAVTRDQTALMWAAGQGHPAVVEALLQYGADVDARTLVRSQYVKTEKPQDSPPSYKIWVEQGGNSALMFAARSGDLRSAQLLVAAGSDVNALSAFGTSPAIMAVHGGNPALLALLLDSGAKVDDASSGHTALHAAVLRGNSDAVTVLLDHGAEPDAILQGSTPVRRQSADYHFHEALVGATPLWLAARYAEPEIMQLLLQGGADASVVNDVSYAAQRGAAALTAAQRRAEASGANPAGAIQPMAQNYIAQEGDISLLMAAVGMGHRRLRVSWGNADRRAGRLGRSREEFILDAATIAVQAGVDINLQDASSQTALAFAKARRYDSVVAFLLAAGARE
jgi:ankyrin repeat protein